MWPAPMRPHYALHSVRLSIRLSEPCQPLTRQEAQLSQRGRAMLRTMNIQFQEWSAATETISDGFLRGLKSDEPYGYTSASTRLVWPHQVNDFAKSLKVGV